MDKKYINPERAGFSQVVTVSANNPRTIYISGQVGVNEKGIPDSLEEQADLAFSNLLKQLRAAGASAGDVVKINTYIKDIDGDSVKTVGKAKAKYFTEEDQPASTWVGVTGLVYPNLLVEVEAIAVVEG